MAAAYNPMTAYKYGSFVEVAYQMFYNNPGNLRPPIPTDIFPAGYNLILYLNAVDHILCDKENKFFGFIAQSQATPSETVVAIRGTEKLIEWLIDAEFLPTPFTPVPAAGDVEDGFFSIYDTMTAVLPSGEQVEDLRTFIKQQAAQGSLVVTGHSLGGSLANMLALDLAVNDGLGALTLYTLAAPKTGGDDFKNLFNQQVPNSFRVYNEPDFVPTVPPLYQQVNTGEEIDSKNFPQIKHSLPCYHELTTYLYVLNQQSQFGLGACAKP